MRFLTLDVAHVASWSQFVPGQGLPCLAAPAPHKCLFFYFHFASAFYPNLSFTISSAVKAGGFKWTAAFLPLGPDSSAVLGQLRSPKNPLLCLVSTSSLSRCNPEPCSPSSMSYPHLHSHVLNHTGHSLTRVVSHVLRGGGGGLCFLARTALSLRPTTWPLSE